MLPDKQKFSAFLSIDRNHQKRTLVSDCSHLIMFRKWLGRKEFNLSSSRDYLYYLKTKDYKNNYIRRIVLTLRDLCRYYNYDWGYQIPMPKLEKTNIEVIDTSEVVKILSYTPRNVYISFYETLALTGLRRREGMNLKVGDLRDGMFHVRESKTGEERYVPCPEFLKEDLHKLLENKTEEDYIFTNKFNRQISENCVKDYLNRLCVKLKIHHVTPHVFRHYFITSMLRANPPGGVAIVARLVGHNNPLQTLTTYQHLLIDDLKKAIMYHPLIRPKQNPYQIMESIENDIKNYKLEDDKRFFFEISKGNDGLRIHIFIR